MHTDWLMWWVSDRFIWIPFYVFLLAVLVRKYGRAVIPILVAIGLLILCSDQLASSLIKPLAQRLRPSHDPAVAPLLHLVRDYRGGTYGFMSSHSANAFGLAAFLHLRTGRDIRWLPPLVFGWAALLCYSRVYLGVHYPSDVLVAALLGSVLALLAVRVSLLVQFLAKPS